MAEQTTPFESLKSFSGIIHRQAIFITNRLDVDSYHLSFLNKQGQRLSDDAKVPTFVQQLPDILPAISDRQTAMLSIPESWRAALYDTPRSSLKLILDINGHSISEATNTRFGFASHAKQNKESNSTDTLLINMQRYEPKRLIEYLPHWRQNHKLLCATNVDDLDLYSFCQSHNLDLLQGQFYRARAF